MVPSSSERCGEGQLTPRRFRSPLTFALLCLALPQTLPDHIVDQLEAEGKEDLAMPWPVTDPLLVELPKKGKPGSLLSKVTFWDLKLNEVAMKQTYEHETAAKIAANKAKQASPTGELC